MRLVVGIPDPNAKHDRIGPTEKDWIVGGTSVSGWAGVPAPEDPCRWVYFWLDGPIAAASYRCYPASQPPSEWKPLQPAQAVFAATGYREEDAADEPGAEIGAAEQLPAGIYSLEFLCCHDGQDVCLDGIRFEVSLDSTAPLRGAVAVIDPHEDQRPWWKFW